MANYWQKLNDPRWQKKRLEALSDNDFRCENCESSTSTLHVHHPAYIKGREPWDYESHELRVLCDRCHKDAHLKIDILTSELNRSKTDPNRSNVEMTIAGFLAALNHDGPFPLNVIDGEFLDGISHYFKVSFRYAESCIENGEIPYSVISKWQKDLR